ncbi:MAG: energy transducer TonB, partial [Planctomycetota bacterium]
DEKGRVSQAKVQTSSHPVFERPALTAIRQWRFEPAKRNGETVSFRLRQEFKFPKQ